MLRDVFGLRLVSAVCPLRCCCRHGARESFKEGLGGKGEDKGVGFASLGKRE